MIMNSSLLYTIVGATTFFIHAILHLVLQYIQHYTLSLTDKIQPLIIIRFYITKNYKTRSVKLLFVFILCFIFRSQTFSFYVGTVLNNWDTVWSVELFYAIITMLIENIAIWRQHREQYLIINVIDTQLKAKVLKRCLLFKIIMLLSCFKPY